MIRSTNVMLVSLLTLAELFVYILASQSSNSNFSSPYVRTPLGGIKGYYKLSWKNRQYAAFEGVPYAMPPIGIRRFQPPVPLPAWEKDIDAISLPTMCPQFNEKSENQNEIIGNEDCLYLNIYVPVLKEKKHLLPVLFWIHGGALQFGSSSKYGAKYLMDRDLILVTINYRLGPFGFLTTGDRIVPGNMGLKDQNMALRWVSQNIQYFNGDSQRISLAGVSAGGASVHFHYLSHLSTGLFHSGISFSGTALSSWAFTKDNSNTTKALAASVGCPLVNSITIVHCLREISAERILQATQELRADYFFSNIQFPPVSEHVESGYFINKSPDDIIESGEVYNAPWITGCVSSEGLVKTGGFIVQEEKMEYINKHWNKLSQYAFDYMYNEDKSKFSKLAELSRKYYLGNHSINTNTEVARNFTSLIGDYLFVVPAQRAAKLQARANKGPVRFYYYTYRSFQSISESLTGTKEDYGVSHGDDTALVLENLNINPTKTKKDRLMLQYMLDDWYSIANTGKPNLGVPWPKLDDESKDFEYMEIAGPGNFTMKINNNLGNIDFWTSIGL